MKNFFFIIIFLISQILTVQADKNIVFVDMEKIMSTSKPGLSILEQLRKINNKDIKTLKDKKDELELKEKKIISQKNILSEKEFQINIDNLKEEINKHNINRDNKINNFNKLKVNNTSKFLQMINLILTKYSKENSISMILQKKNLIIGKKELDITNKIIESVNNDIKPFKIK
jgi:outer membrane protein